MSAPHSTGKVPGIVFDKGIDAESIPGVARVALPIGVNAIESVNMYILADGDKVTVVDCGVWRPDLPDGGLADMEAGLESAGYALQDVSKVIVTHAHIDHYGLAGRVMELTGADLSMHAMTDLDCEKYRHPGHRPRPRAGTPTPTTASRRTSAATWPNISLEWLPYLYSVVEASTRLRGDGADRHRWRQLGSHPHPGTFAGPRLPVVAGPRPAALGRSSAARHHPAGHLRAWLRRRPDAQLPGVAAADPGSPAAAGRIPGTAGRSATRSAASRRSCGTRCAGWTGSGGRSRTGPCTVGALTDRLVAGAHLAHQRQLAINETLAHIAYLRWSGVIERRIRPDGIYEWYSTSDAPLDVARIDRPLTRARPRNPLVERPRCGAAHSVIIHSH